MKRDWDCVRAILAQLESLPTTTSNLHPRDVEGWSAETVSYHLQLLDQAGLISATCRSASGVSLICVGHGLSWSGHELLDAIRRPEAWNRVRSCALEKGIEISFESIKAIASWTVRQVFTGRLA